MVTSFTANSNWDRFVYSVRNWIGVRRPAIINALSKSAEIIISRSQTYYLTNARSRGGLNVQTGRLRSSITKTPVYSSGSGYYIFVGTNVFYGMIWEEGLMPEIITPVRARALRFVIGGRVVFSRYARFTVRRRPFLRPAVEDKSTEIVALLRRAGVTFNY